METIIAIMLLATLIISYILTVRYISRKKNIETAKAAKEVQENVIKFIKDYAGKSEQEFDMPPEEVNEMLDNIEPFSKLPKDCTRWEIKPITKDKLPCLTVEITPKNGKDDFPIIDKIIGNIMRKYFHNANISKFHFKVFFCKVDDCTYYIRMVYATTSSNIKKFKDFVIAQQAQIKRQKLADSAPVHDSELEDELRSIKAVGDKDDEATDN